DVDVAELRLRDLAQSRVHVAQVLGRRRDPVRAPDDHRHLADLALGDPADLVLVIPGRDASGLAEVARRNVGRITHRSWGSVARGPPGHHGTTESGALREIAA